MSTNDRAFLYVAFGILAAINAAGWLAVAPTLPKDWLKDYQTLVGSLLALAGAALTVVFLHKQTDAARRNTQDQIEATSKQSDEALTRRRRAYRAMLPSALSELNSYAQNCAAISGNIRLTISGVVTAVPRPQAAALPDPVSQETFVTIRNCIENAEAGYDEDLSDIVRHYQIQRSRMRQLVSNMTSHNSSSIVTTLDLDGAIVDALLLYAQTAKVFPYARGQPDAKPGQLITQEKMHSAAFNCSIWDTSFPNVHQILARRYPSI